MTRARACSCLARNASAARGSSDAWPCIGGLPCEVVLACLPVKLRYLLPCQQELNAAAALHLLGDAWPGPASLAGSAPCLCSSWRRFWYLRLSW